MEVEQVLHMNEGTGKASYASNSHLQKLFISKAKALIEMSLKELYSAMVPECLKVADLGCSSGPNALMVISEILDITDATYERLNRRPPQVMVFLNDLPGNDFNTIFRSLHDFHEKKGKERSGFGTCFVFGAPGSFYKRLFPGKLLHFIHSANSLHWISQVPKGLVDEDGVALNKGNICVGTTSPPEVRTAYQDQFATDFTSFLGARSEEIVPGGWMALTFLGRSKKTDSFQGLDLVSAALECMASEGSIEKKRLDAFNLPFYLPSAEDVAELIEMEGSFSLYKLDYLTMDLEDDVKIKDKEEKVKFWINNVVRPVLEPILASEFGEAMVDDLFQRAQQIGFKQCNMNVYRMTSLAISLNKK